MPHWLGLSDRQPFDATLARVGESVALETALACPHQHMLDGNSHTTAARILQLHHHEMPTRPTACALGAQAGDGPGDTGPFGGVGRGAIDVCVVRCAATAARSCRMRRGEQWVCSVSALPCCPDQTWTLRAA